MARSHYDRERLDTVLLLIVPHQPHPTRPRRYLNPPTPSYHSHTLSYILLDRSSLLPHPNASLLSHPTSSYRIVSPILHWILLSTLLPDRASPPCCLSPRQEHNPRERELRIVPPGHSHPRPRWDYARGVPLRGEITAYPTRSYLISTPSSQRSEN